MELLAVEVAMGRVPHLSLTLYIYLSVYLSMHIYLSPYPPLSLHPSVSRFLSPTKRTSTCTTVTPLQEAPHRTPQGAVLFFVCGYGWGPIGYCDEHNNNNMVEYIQIKTHRKSRNKGIVGLDPATNPVGYLEDDDPILSKSLSTSCQAQFKPARPQPRIITQGSLRCCRLTGAATPLDRGHITGRFEILFQIRCG